MTSLKKSCWHFGYCCVYHCSVRSVSGIKWMEGGELPKLAGFNIQNLSS